MSVQILLTALERIENHESGELIAKNDSCEECKHMILIAEKALADYQAAPDHTVVTCVYCGMEYPDGTPAAKAKTLTDHIKVCPSHPMRDAETALKNKQAQCEVQAKVIKDMHDAYGSRLHSMASLLAICEIGSCSCMTKSPDEAFHKEDCRYRKIRTILNEYEKSKA